MKKPKFLKGLLAATIYAVVTGVILRIAFIKSGDWDLKDYLNFYGIYGPTVAAVFWLFSKRRSLPPVTSTGDTADNASKSKAAHDRFSLGCAAFVISATGSMVFVLFYVFAFDVHPMDRAGIVYTYGLIGLIASGAVSAAIGLSSMFE